MIIESMELDLPVTYTDVTHFKTNTQLPSLLQLGNSFNTLVELELNKPLLICSKHDGRRTSLLRVVLYQLALNNETVYCYNETSDTKRTFNKSNQVVFRGNHYIELLKEINSRLDDISGKNTMFIIIENINELDECVTRKIINCLTSYSDLLKIIPILTARDSTQILNDYQYIIDISDKTYEVIYAQNANYMNVEPFYLESYQLF